MDVFIFTNATSRSRPNLQSFGMGNSNFLEGEDTGYQFEGLLMGRQDFEVKDISDMEGENEEETNLLLLYFQEAQKYLSGFNWCEKVHASFFGFGVGGILGVFLFHIKIRNDGNEILWVVAGDLPTVYLVADRAKNSQEALSIYCELMDDWIRKAIGESIETDVFPISVEMTQENAELLAKRILFIRNSILKSE